MATGQLQETIAFLAVFFGVGLMSLGTFVGVEGAGRGPRLQIVPMVGSSQDYPIARVNGSEIRLSDVVLARKELPPEVKAMPDDIVVEYLIEQLIDRKLMAEAAWKEGLGREPDTQSHLNHYRESVLRDSYLLKVMDEDVTDQALFSLYERKYLQPEKLEEFHLHQILLRTEEDALVAMARIEGGDSFFDLARQLSTDSTASVDGDLGYTGLDLMIPETAEVVRELPVGKASAPFLSRFGWHIVLVSDRRQKKIPRFEDVRDEFKEQLVREVIGRRIGTLREDARIERLHDLDGSELDNEIFASQ